MYILAFYRTFQSLDENDDDPQLPHNENSSAFIKLKKKSEAEKELESALILEDADMEICDPCYCYTKCWLDTVASLFCVSLLWLQSVPSAFRIAILYLQMSLAAWPSVGGCFDIIWF